MIGGQASRCLSALLLISAIFTFFVFIPGCGGGGDEQETAFDPVPREMIEDPRFGVYPKERIDAVLGQPMVILIELAGGYLPADVGEVRLDDGRELETTLVWYGARPQPASGVWLEPAGEWSVRTLDEVIERGLPTGEAGTWAILLDPPIDAVGQGLWIAGRRHMVNWLPDTSEVASRASAQAWRSPVPREMRNAQRLRFLVEPVRRHPLRRWRMRLLMDELTPRVERRVANLDGTIRRPNPDAREDDRFEDARLERLARHRESLWTIALARLDQADDELAERVRERLCAVVDFGGGEVAPFWSSSESDLSVLLSDLLDQRLTARERARRARVWVESQPSSMAWIVSDAPRSDALTDQPLATVAVANASGGSRLVSVRSTRDPSGSELSSLGALRARAYLAAVRTDAGVTPSVFTKVGEKEQVLGVPGASVEAMPPGLSIERFFGDWTLRELLAQVGPPSPGGELSRCAALLYKDPSGQWMLYAQCRARPDSGSAERLRLTLGPEGGTGDRVIEIERGQQALTGELGAEAIQCETGEFPDGWFARVVIPKTSIENEGRVLRLGIERIDALGRRSAWPRPMLPWQGEAPRALIDLEAWDRSGR